MYKAWVQKTGAPPLCRFPLKSNRHDLSACPEYQAFFFSSTKDL